MGIVDHNVHDLTATDPAVPIPLPTPGHPDEEVWLDITGQSGAALPGDIELVLASDAEEGTRITTDTIGLGPYRINSVELFAFASPNVAFRVTVNRGG